MLDLNDTQQQRYLKAFDITKRILLDIKIFPTNDTEKQQVFELDEMETGYPKMTVKHIYDVVKACAELAAGEKKAEDFADPEYRFYSGHFMQHKSAVSTQWQ